MALVLVAVYALYLVAGNVILGTGLLRSWLNGNPEKVKVEYASAWTPWPGRISVRGLSLRYQDDNLQMLLGLGTATVDIDLPALTNHTFRAKRLRATDAVFRLRNRVESLEGVAGRVAAFPPIDGFADPPVHPREARKKKPPIPEDQYDLWAVQLDDISASIREIWTMEVRYRGAGSIAGGFKLRPRRDLSIAPSVVLLDGGIVSIGEEDLVRGNVSRIAANMDAYDVRVPKGTEVFRHLSATVHQSGEVVSLAGVARTYGAGSGVTVSGGAGSLASDVRIEHGVLLPESRASYQTSDVRVTTPVGSVASDVALVARVQQSAEKPTLLADATIGRAALRFPGARADAVDVRDAHATADLGNADLAASFSLAAVSVGVTSAYAANVRELQPLAPERVTFESGALGMSARGEYRDGRLDGRVEASLEAVRATLANVSLVATGKAFSNVVAKDVATSIVLPSSAVDLHDIAIRSGSGHAEGLWLRARTTTATISPKARTAHITIAATSGPGDRTMAFFTRMASLPDIAAEAAAGEDLTALMHVQLRPRDVLFTVEQAKNGALGGAGRLHKQAERPLTGAFLLTLGPARAGLSLDGGGMSVHPFASPEWLAEKLRTH